jgi:sugar phosphate isomerase/epimerase
MGSSDIQIYISAWSLKEIIQAGKPNIEDLPEFAISHGFDGIEIADRQIKAFDTKYLEGLKRKCRQFNCGLILDVSSDLTFLDDKDWSSQITYVLNMLDTAKHLGACKVRVYLGGQSLSLQKIFKPFITSSLEKTGNASIFQPVTNFIFKLMVNEYTVRFARNFRKRGKSTVTNEALKIKRAIESLRIILPKAQQYKIPLVIENHWGISSRPENILKIVNELNSPFIGTCPDFTNFPKDVNPYDGLRKLASKALHVHTKCLNPDTNRDEQDTYFRECLQIFKDSSYTGTMTTEYEGSGDALNGCLRTKDLIIKYW